MIKKITSILLTTALTATTVFAELPEPENSEVIDLYVKSVEISELRTC